MSSTGRGFGSTPITREEGVEGDARPEAGAGDEADEDAEREGAAQEEPGPALPAALEARGAELGQALRGRGGGDLLLDGGQRVVHGPRGAVGA
jgi:hypothetical protein